MRGSDLRGNRAVPIGQCQSGSANRAVPIRRCQSVQGNGPHSIAIGFGGTGLSVRVPKVPDNIHFPPDSPTPCPQTSPR